MIFQVTGKPENYDEKEFVLDGETYATCLCTDALRQHLKKEDGVEARLTIFVPESLLIDKSLEDVCGIIREKGISDFEAITIPSVGKYPGKSGEFKEFRGNVETITTAIFLHFLKVKPDKFYIDISTGFNIYPIALLEAAKRYLTYRKLERILQQKSDVEAYTLFTPPIVGEDRYHAEIQPIDVKAFFSLPKADVKTIASGNHQEWRAEKIKK